MIAMMLRERDTMANTDLSSVEFIRMGSAPVSEALMAATHKTLPKAKVTNAYGTTEAGPVVFGPHPKDSPQPESSVGYPHPLVQLRLVEGDNRNADQGGLEMKSPAMMNGYHNRPDVPPPFTEDGFYITKDVFRRDENGFHYFIGRTDDMFVSGGENIYPADVERMLETNPDVSQAAVIPVNDDIKGTKPVAFIIPKAGHAPTEDTIKKYALANAPAFQHPRFVWFVDELPLASTNKVDRSQRSEPPPSACARRSRYRKIVVTGSARPRESGDSPERLWIPAREARRRNSSATSVPPSPAPAASGRPLLSGTHASCPGSIRMIGSKALVRSAPSASPVPASASGWASSDLVDDRLRRARAGRSRPCE